MTVFFRLFAILLLLLPTNSHAEQEVSENTKQAQPSSIKEPLAAVNKETEVGKHVMANTDAGSMILSLLMVLALIVISAFVLKRFKFTQQQGGQLKVVASLSLGVKERIVVAQVGEQQLVLGVTSQQITLIKSLEEPIDSSHSEKGSTSALTENIIGFLKTTNFNTKKTK
jgi:flagellar protein FliO/FliZ